MVRMLLITACLITLSVHGQDGCPFTDYMRFDSVMTSTAVPFGANTPVAGGAAQTLYMDVYEPVGDTSAHRPAVVITYGGSFIGGSRADVAPLCRTFARLGYVAVAPDYRTGLFLPNEFTTTLAVMRGDHDMRACVRYLRRSVAELGDPYRIDTGRIIQGGISAGAISAIHATYLDKSSEIPPILYGDTADLGGIEGNSGNPGYSSAVAACFSFSGAIGDTSWIEAGDVPLCSLHEVGDQVVPYGTQEVSVFGIPTGLVASGSHDIHLRMDHIGVPNCFLSYPGSDHVGYLTYDETNAIDLVVQFCSRVVCGEPAGCGTLYAAVPDHADPEQFELVPNPADIFTTIRSDRPGTFVLMDQQGRVLREVEVGSGADRVPTTDLASGLYLVRSMGSSKVSGKLLVVH
ncbi:MAG: carboxylesterase family protein [Flavobacteriales bacterium]|nr:carboxylesterase family protein [Flavobacteriales bacterium]MCB9193865.1 carboxylesterase family protein [Flavobacteriales bacterium]